MNERDKIIGFCYFLVGLLGLPIVLGFLVALFIWAPTGGWIELWKVYTFGIIATAFVVAPLVPRMYTVNAAYMVSFWLDPYFGKKPLTTGGVDHLISRGPGFHFRGFWEEFDSITEHEKEVRISLDGKFETSGDSLNLEVKGGVLILSLPMTSARLLRSVAKGMDKIREEIREQLTPSLKQATAETFIQFSSDYIMCNQTSVAHNIRQDFENKTQIRSRYGLETMKFTLGDVNFSDKINSARETAKGAELRGKAAKRLKGDLGIESGREAMEFVIASENPESMKVNRHHLVVEGIDEGLAGAIVALAETLKKK